jgi:RNA polymerase sigma-70 factor (ECF subfamily)
MAELIGRQGRWVRGVIFGVLGRVDEVDDVAQRVWMQVWREAPRLADAARWRAWLYRIARNAATDTHRRRRRRRKALDQIAQQPADRPSAPAGPEHALLAGERQAIMLDAIEALPALYREPFVLKHLQDLSYRQIAELLDVPTDTVETRLVRARRLLREKLGGMLEVRSER